jgi:deoxyribonuclease-2
MLVLLASLGLCGLQCRSINDEDVDTWAAFKVPSAAGGWSGLGKGTAFFYRDDATPLTGATGDVSSTSQNPIYYSIAPLWNKSADIGYVLFNNQPPDGNDASSSYANSRGVFLFDHDGGLFITHSAGHFPPNPSYDGYSFPESSEKYGQSFGCFSFPLASLDKVAADLLVERPYLYASKFPSWASPLLPNIAKLLTGYYEKDITNTVSYLPTTGGNEVVHLAKSKSWGREIYHDLVAPTFQGNVYSETWALGVGTLPSDCSGAYEAHNILTVNFKGVAWKRTQDHSVWALVAQTVCLGDVNRQNGQLSRGGGTFCLTDVPFSADIKNVITDIEECTDSHVRAEREERPKVHKV